MEFLFVLDQDRNAESPQCLLKHGSVFMLRMEKKKILLGSSNPHVT